MIGRLLKDKEIKSLITRSVNNTIKHAKETFINKIDYILLNQEPGNSCKTFWQVTGRFIRRKCTPVIIPPLRKHDGTYGFTDYKKAEELNY